MTKFWQVVLATFYILIVMGTAAFVLSPMPIWLGVLAGVGTGLVIAITVTAILRH